MNLSQIVANTIAAVVPRQDIAIYQFYSQTVSASGISIPTYYAPIYTDAQIELEYKREMQYEESITATEVTRRFYILSDTINGLNRALQTAGDYIQIIDSGFYYKIIEVREKFKTGWTSVIGIEDPGFTPTIVS